MAKDKPDIWWVTKPKDLVGNALGYQTHNSNMLKHTEPFINIKDHSKIALQITSADHYVHIPNKINVLFTMWEFLDVPDSYKKALAQADYVVVPCRFCKEIFKPYTKREPIVCWEGTDPAVFKYVEREIKGRFRYLWVGAPNPRKGYQSILQVVNIADKFPNIEFYLKTTTKKVTLMQAIKATFKNWKDISDVDDAQGWKAVWRILKRVPSPFNSEKVFRYGKNKNVIVDTRKLPLLDLVALYHSAHCFLFPTMGEGWGLTLCEAMATGLPSIAVSQTGCKDFFDDEVGYCIKSDIKNLGKLPNYGLDECKAYVPDTQSMFDKMMLVYANYDRAKQIGKRASVRIQNKFTWQKSGARLAEILKEIHDAEFDSKDNRLASLLVPKPCECTAV